MPKPLVRIQFLIQGQVQGVGFRPCVYHLASQLGCTGFINNNPSGVLIELQGDAVEDFIPYLKANAPPLAQIDAIHVQHIPVIAHESTFQILTSTSGKANTIIAPDAAICDACLEELFNPCSRYYRYPFLNCTQCGPRYSITHEVPYDRHHTSMQPFPLCLECKKEYDDPLNRRFHAQPTACHGCGPKLSESIEEVAQAILQGEIVALKGLGGYQLICDARHHKAIHTLRIRKNRQAKPFGLMHANLASIAEWVVMSPAGEAALKSRARPMVLLPIKESVIQSFDSIAPGLNHLGFMLPYTPLHYLLFNALAGNPSGTTWLDEIQAVPLVVTSANPHGAPIITDDLEAEKELSQIADRIVSYNRAIVTRVDDSVVRIIDKAPMMIRRARGLTPKAIALAHEIPETLALGGHLKNTVCITRGKEAFVSQHIGSLTNKATLDFFHETVNHLLYFLKVTPKRIAHDAHPDFYTSHWARQYALPAFPIQHHRAHVASVIVEHGLARPVLGLALDGYGYGDEGQSFGGELFYVDDLVFHRIGTFEPLAQPGGEQAAREPWRMASSVLHRLGRGAEIKTRFAAMAQAPYMEQLLDKDAFCPKTHSCGRLFDAASALLGRQWVTQYEGQAAIELESLVRELVVLPDGWRISPNGFDLLPTMAVLADCDNPIEGANLFHGTLIAGLADWLDTQCVEHKVFDVVLSGGCFLNRVLTEGLISALKVHHIKAYIPRALPPNDGGLSLGQAWIAGNYKE